MREDILRELYETHYRSAYLYALSLCKERTWAEDIVSDAFERAMVTLEEGGQGFRYWLLRVCKNLFLDEVRRRRYRSAEPFSEVVVPEDAPELNVDLIPNEDTNDATEQENEESKDADVVDTNSPATEDADTNDAVTEDVTVEEENTENMETPEGEAA